MNHSNGFSNGRPLSSPSIFSSESASPTSPIESGCCRYPRSKSVNSLFYKSDKGTNSIKRLPKFTWAIFKGRDKSKKSKEPKNDHGLKRHPVKKVTSWQFVQPETEIDIPVSDRPSMKGNTLERIEFDTRTVLSEQRMQTFTIVPTKLTPSPALRTQPSSKTPTPTKSLRRQVLNKDSNKKHSPIMIKNVPRSPGPLDGSLYTQVKKRRPGETDDSDASNSSLSLNKGYTSHDEIPTTSALSLTIENDQDDLQYSGYSDDSTRSSPSDEAPSFMTSQTHEYEELIQDAEASMASSKYTVNDITIGLKEDETTSSVMTSDLNQEHAEETTNLYTRPEINHNYDVIQGQDDKPENLSISNDDVAYSNDVIASLPGQGKVANIESSADKERDNLDSVEVSPLYVATERMPDCDSTSVNVNVNEPTTMTSQVSAANMLQPSPSNHLTQLDVDNAMALVNECLADTEERGYCDNNANINDFNGNLEPPEFSPIQPDYPALEIDTRFEEKGPEYALPVRDVVLGTIPARKALLVSNTSSQKFIMNQADLENNNNPTDLKNSKINDPNLDGNGYSTIEDINTISSPASKQSLNVSGGGNSDGDSGIDGTTMVHTTSISDVNTPDAASSVSSLNQNKTEPEVKQVFLHIPQKAAEVDIITIKNVVHESSDSLPQPQSTQSSPSLSSPTLTNTSEKMEEEQGGEEQDEDEEERRMREEIENTRKKLLDLESKHNTLRRRKEETKRHSLGYKIAQTNDSMDILLPSPNHVISATLPRSTGVHHSQPDPKPPTSHLSDKEQQEIDELLRSVQDLDIMTSQRADDAITAIEQQSFPTSESVTMATTALTADPVALQNNSYSRYHDANRGSSVGVFTPAYAHPMHQPQHMERENLHTQLQLQKQEENARMQQKEELERQRRSLEYEQQKLLQEQRQREYNRHKELEQERRNQYESHLLVQKQQEREFLIQESKRQAEREKQEKFQLAFDQKQRVLQEQQKYVTQPPPAPHVDRFPKAEIEQKAMQLEVQRRTSLSMEALEARVAVASQPQLVTPQALGQTSQPVKSDDLQLQLDELDKYIQQLTQPTAEPLTDKSEPVAASVAAIPPKRNSEVVRRNRRSFTVDLERKLDPNIPLSPEDLVNTSMFAKDEPPRPPSRTKSSYNSVRRHSHGFDLAQMIQIDINPEVQRHADKNDDVFSPLTSPNPSYPPQSSKTRPLQQKVPNVGYTPPPATQPTPPPKKSVSLEERLSPQLFLAMTVNPGARPVENVHSYKEDQVEEQRMDEVDSAPPPQTPGFPVSPKTPYVNLSSPEPNHVPIGFTKTPLSALGLKPNERPQRAIDDVSSSDSDVTGNNTQDMGKLYLPKHKSNFMCLKILVSANYSGFPLEIITENNSSTFPRMLKDGITYKKSNSIARVVSGDLLWGSNIEEQSLIYQWLEFADHEIYPPICTWSFPFLAIRNYNKLEVTKAVESVERCLKILNDHLLRNMFLVGERITFADISCAAALLLGFQMVIDESMRSKYKNAIRWFRTVVNQSEFRNCLNSNECGDTGTELQLCQTTPKFDKKVFDDLKRKLNEESESQAAKKPTESKSPEKSEKPKTDAQLKKEAKKREKMEKFNAKNKKLKEKSKLQPAKAKSKGNEKSDKKATIVKYDKDTPEGEKKDISGSMPDSYSPQYVEAVWYSWWEKQGFFKPEHGKENVYAPNPKGMFMCCLPPPNVTGSLHLGHALTNTVEDVLTRWHRMKGKTVLWAPGTDHAGIATQVVVEKKLWREKKLTRHDLGREDFVKEVWKWKKEKGNRICLQLRKLGSSLDWDREFFTMNDKLSAAVKECFVRLHEKGTIFRSNRLVNWSCALRSAISDIEVNKQELTGRTMLFVPGYDHKVEFGVLVLFAYPVIGGSPGEEVVVATTRIETMLGDTGVAVHPEDPRFKHLHGKFVQHPFSDRKLPIVCDEMVERDFGTGAVKITPSHDPNDYECGKRHNLRFINIFTDEGYVANTDTKFDGMKRFTARTAVTEALKEKGLYKETKDNPMVVPICSRSKDIVEPMIKLQWFMDCSEAARLSVEVVRNGELKLIPEMHKKVWYHWLENSRDWCISRQLWWGHRIPAYFVTIDDPNVPKGEEIDNKYWVSGRSEEEAREKAAEKFNVCKSKISLRQDEDVLDTWFSSGLLPFSIFGWPNETEDLKFFYPGTLLETGHDIIFFWVARMVMFSLILNGKLPFTEVYLHAMVRDAHGRKMSKSLGNVIDPIDVINGITLEDLHKSLLSGNLDDREVDRAKAGQKQDFPNGIPECGSDALRFALCAYTCQGRDINLDVNRILGYRHFCNKLWNAFKFAARGLGDNFTPNTSAELTGNESLTDKWILSKLNNALTASEKGLSTYEFPLYTTAVYNFWLYELCDIYLECLKPVFAGSNQTAITTSRNVLYTCLDTALKLTTPLMPFLSEELWQRLPRRQSDETKSVTVAEWPESQDAWSNPVVESEMELAMNITRTTRSLRSEYNLTRTKADLYIRCADEDTSKTVQNFTDVIQTLSYSSNTQILSQDKKSPPGCAVAIVNDKCDVNLMLKGLIDLEKEVAKLQTKQASQKQKIKALSEKILKPEYSEKVPANVQTQDAEKMQQLEAELKKMISAEEDFKRMQIA